MMYLVYITVIQYFIQFGLKKIHSYKSELFPTQPRLVLYFSTVHLKRPSKHVIIYRAL
jgi:hypothetical protein